MATFEEPRTAAFLNVPLPRGGRAYSERTAQTIDDEIGTLLADAHGRVTDTLRARRAQLAALAKLLLEKEVVDRATLDGVLGTVGVSPRGPDEARRLRTI